MSLLYRYGLYALAALAIVAGGLGYRSHLLSTGHAAGAAEAAAVATEARLLALRADSALAERTALQTRATLASLKATHEEVTTGLGKALLASDHRNQRLNARIASLLDQAAGVRAGTPPDSLGSGSAPGAPEGNSTVADLIETTSENLAICRRNSARLAGLQAWYEQLRKANAQE